MRTVCIIQARMTSTRLPGKVMMDIGGRPMIWHVLERALTIGCPIAVAIPETGSDEIVGEVTGRAILCRGPEDDVLARYYHAAKELRVDCIMRITADCPLIDPNACKMVLDNFCPRHAIVANDYYRTYPDGLGCEVFSFEALEIAHQKATKAFEREHVTTYIRKHQHFSPANIRCPITGIENLKLSVDTEPDLELIRRIDAAHPVDFSLEATLEAIDRVKAQDLAQGA